MSVKRVNIDLNKGLWKEVGVMAAKLGINKRELVEEALHQYIRKQNKRLPEEPPPGQLDIDDYRESL